MPRPITTAVAVSFITLVHLADGIIFTECELQMELRRQGFPENQLDQWLCLIEAESSKETDAIGGPDSDGSFDYGLFQINDRYWCSSGNLPGKGCNIRCTATAYAWRTGHGNAILSWRSKDLLSDNITEAARCAMLIYERQGLRAWVGWNNECKGKRLPKIKC